MRLKFVFFAVMIGFLGNSVFGFWYPDYNEVPEPGLLTAMYSMRAHETQWNNYNLYTMNVDTPGFTEIGGYNILNEKGQIEMLPFTRWRHGPISDTGRELDFYLDAEGRGFFIININGNLAFTKDGRFKLDENRRLVMLAGDFPVMGESGEIYLPEGDEIAVSASGLIFVDNDPVEKLKIVVFESFDDMQALETLNGSIWILTKDIPRLEGPEYYKIHQGSLEENNVLKALIGDGKFWTRGYEGSTKAIKSLIKVMNSTAAMAGQ